MPRSQEGLARLVEKIKLRDPRIAQAYGDIDRGDFVPREMQSIAYADRPVVLPQQQTTSQPTLIALMIDAAEVGKDDRVLEVGTGYGFQTALLAHLAASVVSIERWPELAEAARGNLRRAEIVDVDVRTGDGFEGCPDAAPFDAIIVSAAAPRVPPALARQLAEGGRLVIPVVDVGGDLVSVYRKQDGAVTRARVVTPARFVPLVEGSPE